MEMMLRSYINYIREGERERERERFMICLFDGEDVEKLYKSHSGERERERERFMLCPREVNKIKSQKKNN